MALSEAEEAFPERERQQSAWVLGAGLGVLSLSAGASAVALYLDRGFVLSDRLVFVALVLVFAVAAIAGWLELRRARLAEAFALAAIFGGIATGVASITAALWLTGLVQTIAGVACAVFLARRFIVRDESRHKPRAA